MTSTDPSSSAPAATTGVIPAVRPTVPAQLPAVTDHTLGNGLRVLVVERSSVPIVEVRLRIPFAGAGAAHQARAEVLAETLFTGSPRFDRVGLATQVQRLGGSLSTGVDSDRLAVVGSALATNLEPLLEILAEVLRGATYPDDEVAGERDRIVEDTAVARSQPAVIAREALLERLFGDHPYATGIADPEVVGQVGPADVRALHAERVSPAGAILTLVGDVRAERAIAAVTASLGGWTGRAADPAPPLPALRTGPLIIVDRPGAVQTNIRLGGEALDRSAPGYPAQRLANTIFGGYFSSRLVDNIREDKGYTYSPRSSVDHYQVGSRFTVAADVATEVTGPALLEIGYELGRLAVLPPTQEELDAARQYAVGTLALGSATAAGLAATLSALAGVGLGVEYLRDHPRALAEVTLDDVRAAAAELLAPTRLVTVLVGDRARIAAAVGALGLVADA
ncbi:putative Zn-dependent peptidase [Frankia canadensis]|uniref:Putative Zn-dependent peptidase n=1 Tax=Frankia canadensis TaxID=1836972 RepID=A0A2I2KK62_9ACTN|nr:putative Zn-dependent peptidase [Frankia canadensis]SOU53324.1 putative Zn-dependent peptidase [Frankia canadensis]